MAFDDHIRPLLDTPEPPALGPGPRQSTESVAALEARLDGVLAQCDLSRERQALVKALVLLWHDHLEESHSLCQQIGSRDGSYVHGLMHRREPDYGNAKYWFHKVGTHPSFEDLAARVNAQLERRDADSLAKALLPSGRWDAFAMVDLCERAHRTDDSALETSVIAIQALEFEVLLGYLGR